MRINQTPAGAFQIYAIHPDGSGLTQITDSASNQFPAWSPDGTRLAVRRDVDIYIIDLVGGSAPLRLTTVGPLNQMPSWSPDGTRIAFMSTRELPGNYPSVFMMNVDGTDQVDLTKKPDSVTGAWSSRAPAWSPNGKFIYFTGTRPDLTSEQIYVMACRWQRSNTTDHGRRECRGDSSTRSAPGNHQPRSHARRSVAGE